jgi:uracil-DNA glycosylase
VNRLVEPIGRVLDRAPKAWADVVQAWRAGPDGRRLEAFIGSRQDAGARIYPAAVLKALELTAPDEVRVVIVGQDPYHRPGQAEGLAFSVPEGERVPPSLRNILQEIRRDIGVDPAGRGHLGGWARQGVLLINTCLTVEEGCPGAHACQGWEVLTDELIKATAGSDRPKVFMLWGAHAQSKAALARQSGRHDVLCANHPSPLSARRGPAPFVGCGHFGAANRWLQAKGQVAVDWSLGPQDTRARSEPRTAVL